MFLVYEKNYLSYGDVDCIEETDMKLFSKKENAIKKFKIIIYCKKNLHPDNNPCYNHLRRLIRAAQIEE